MEYTADDVNGFNAVVSKQLLNDKDSLRDSASSHYNSIELLQSQQLAQYIADAQAQSDRYAKSQALAEEKVIAETMNQIQMNSTSEENIDSTENQTVTNLKEKFEENSKEKVQEQQLLNSKLDQSEMILTNKQNLLLPQSQRSHTPSNIVHTTVISHPSTDFSHTLSGPVITDPDNIAALKDIIDDGARVTIDRTFEPQILITQPPSATVQASVIYSPFSFLNVRRHFDSRITNNGLARVKENLKENVSGQQFLLKKLNGNEIQNTEVFHSTKSATTENDNDSINGKSNDIDIITSNGGEYAQNPNSKLYFHDHRSNDVRRSLIQDVENIHNNSNESGKRHQRS